MLCYKQKICDKEGEQMTIDLALEKMIPGMQEIYGDMVDSIILYGSTACGTRAEDLDVDVAILLRAGATNIRAFYCSICSEQKGRYTQYDLLHRSILRCFGIFY